MKIIQYYSIVSLEVTVGAGVLVITPAVPIVPVLDETAGGGAGQQDTLEST